MYVQIIEGHNAYKVNDKFNESSCHIFARSIVLGWSTAFDEAIYDMASDKLRERV